MPPNPQPQTSWTAKYRPTPAGAGTSAKGQGPKYKGPAGKFQWGSDQYGYINPQGTIAWNAQAPTGSQKTIGYGGVGKYAKATGQSAKDKWGRPIVAQATEAPYLGADYSAAKLRLIKQRNDLMREMSLNIGDMSRRGEELFGKTQADFESGTAGLFGTQANTERQALQAKLAAAGMSRSGISGQQTLQQEATKTAERRQLEEQFGPAALERMRGEQSKLDSDLRWELQQMQAQGKELALAQNKELVAAGQAPRWSDAEISGNTPKGFKKEGSTWFYTNKHGVKVSVQGNPYMRQASATSRLLMLERGRDKPNQKKIKSLEGRLKMLKEKM